MVVEGEFPKSDGDILYGSETTRFAGAGRCIIIGSTITGGSATAVINLGSVIIGAGSLTNPCHITIDYRDEMSAPSYITTQISGMSANASIELGSAPVGAGGADNKITIIAGSPLEGMITGFGLSDAIHVRYIDKDYAHLDHLDTGSEVVVNFALGSETNPGLGIIHVYSIQSFRNSI